MRLFYKLVLKIIFWSCSALLLLALTVFAYFAKDLPRPEKFLEHQVAQTSKIYDRTRQILLYSIYGEERRTLVKLQDISQYLKDAVVATEDSKFYQHRGLDFGGILRSVWLNLKTGSINYGGSTISQQLIRSTFLSLDKTLSRKVRELILTLELERRYDKNQILEWYLNQVPFGNNAYGAEAAAQTYFGKAASELSLAEAATLAALIQGPSYYSPYGEHRAELLDRKNYVLARMRDESFIGAAQFTEAQKQELVFKENKTTILAPHFTLYVKSLLEQEFGADFLATHGLRVYASLDFELQKQAEELAQKYANQNAGWRAYNLALVALDPKNGAVLAMVGSKDWFGQPYPKDCISGSTCLFEPQFNVAASAPGRQPGSAFKPFVYATAFENGYDDETIVVDELTNFGIWGGKSYIPQNYDGRCRGAITLREALAQSLNVPSVKVLAYLAGLQDSINTAQEMGISTLDRPASFYGLSLVLGGGEVKPIDMAVSYGVFANRGRFVPYQPILRIFDQQGNLLKNNVIETPGKSVLSEKTADLITSLLSDNQARTPIFGANSALNLPGAAVKTGTTNEARDAWAIGYNDKLVVAVWAGNNDNSPTNDKPGIILAAPLWREFFVRAIEKINSP